MLAFSTYLSNALLATGSLKSLMDGGKLYIYSGPVPATADEAVDGTSVLLCTVTAAAGAGLTFDGAPANGVLKKTAAEVWSGVNAATGDASFYRFAVGADTGAGAAGAGNYRVQGSVGTDASFDLELPAVALTSGNTQAIDSFQWFVDQ